MRFSNLVLTNQMSVFLIAIHVLYILTYIHCFPIHYGHALEPRPFVQEIGEQSKALETLKFLLHCCLSQLSTYAYIHFRMVSQRSILQALRDTQESWSHCCLLGPILTYRGR